MYYFTSKNTWFTNRKIGEAWIINHTSDKKLINIKITNEKLVAVPLPNINYCNEEWHKSTQEEINLFNYFGGKELLIKEKLKEI